MNNPSAVPSQPFSTTVTTETSFLDTLTPAKAWGARGRRVFPVWPVHPVTGFCCCKKGKDCDDKHPVLTGGHNKSSTDPVEIERLWREARAYIARIAARQGLPFPLPDPAIGGSSHDLIIFDLDGPEGIEEFMGASDGGGFGEPHIVKSGRLTAGYHYTYKIPADLDPKLRDKLTIWRPGEGHVKGGGGLDGRCNGKGFVVLPPSRHRSGQCYVEIDARDPGECPSDLLDLAFTKIAASRSQTKDEFLADAKRQPRRRESTGASQVKRRQSAIQQGSRMERMSAGEGGLWNPRTEHETALVRLALQTIDPDAFKGLTGRPNINQQVWRNCIWSLRAWGDFWRDDYAHDLALAWSREFASQDDAKFYEQFWNFRSAGPEFGRRELLKQATAVKSNWRDAIDPPVPMPYVEAQDPRPDAVILQFPPAPVQPLVDVLEKGSGDSDLEASDCEIIGLPKGQKLADTRLGAFCTTKITYRYLNKERKPATSDGRNTHDAFDLWRFRFRYDHFTRKTWVFFKDGSKKKIDDSFEEEVYDLLVKSGLSVNLNTLSNLIRGAGKRDQFDMARDWIDSIPAWDGVTRAESIFTRVFGVPDDAEHRGMARLFGAQLVRRALKPGYKSDHMIVIKSKEGLGKSTFFKNLVPEEFFTDSLTFDMKAKEIIENTEGVLLAEMAELINITRKETDHCKHYISRTHDKSRLAFGRNTTDIPRYFTMVGSTNDEKPLQSRTGNRRFLIMKINKVGNTQWVKDNLLQIWAEFKEIEKNYGVALELPADLRETAAKRQEESLDYSPLEEYLYDQVSEIKEGFIPNHQIYAFLGFRDLVGSNAHKAAFRLAKQTLERAGWSTSIEDENPRTKEKKTIDRRDGVRGFFKGAGITRYVSFCIDDSRISAVIIPKDGPNPSTPIGGGSGGDGVEHGDSSLPGSDAGGTGEADYGRSEVQDSGPVHFNPPEFLPPQLGHTVFVGGASPGSGVGRAPVVYDPAFKNGRGDGPS
jgi:Virulence-associated protein E/Bifunctional DNA primase/polymerase, N-terminal